MQDNNFIKLYETEKYLVGHIFENAYLLKKETGKTTLIGDFYGEPSCALISQNNKWCIVGGSTLKIWTEDEVFEIKDDNLYWACKLMQVDINKVEILIDPWADNSSIWELNIQTKEYKKLMDFNNYKNQQYTDEIEW